ncbi:hypothetical protein ABFS83_10G077000 [Erythranthe nasuta]
MAKVAAAGQLPKSSTLNFGGAASVGGSTLKRKTPTELRGELLKPKNLVELADESPSITSFMRNADGAVSKAKKLDSSKAPRSTRIDDHYPITKTSRLLSRKENSKENVPNRCVSSLKNFSIPMNLNAKNQMQNSCQDDSVALEGGKDSSNPINTFKSVRELSLGAENLNGFSYVDMGKALKGLVSCDPHAASALLPESIDNTGKNMAKSFCSELHIPGHKIPLDLTLKTSMRLTSSSSVNWFHRLINCATLNDMGLFSSGCQSQSMACSPEPTSTSGNFHSWVHPQSTLPREVISALTSASGGQMDFLSKRQQAWEDSFRCLYYMLRKKVCKMFYVCGGEFVVMFIASDSPKETECSCYAYVSQSTRTLRSLLKEHDVSFSMPLCRSKVEEVTAEDLVELSQIEKYNLGQTRATESTVDVDKTPQSLLMFTGNKNVHALYDFLLNYRSLFASFTGGDVPMLYSPVLFENATLSAPEVKCKQTKKVDYTGSQLMGSNIDNESKSRSSPAMHYSIEIRDTYIPPWIVCGICNSMRSNGADFEARFVTKSSSIGLNIGLDTTKDNPLPVADVEKPFEESGGYSFSIPNTTLSLQGHSAYVRELKYGDSSYTAFLSPVE